jgi:hypothetical protein
MSYHPSRRHTTLQPPLDPADFDAFLLEDEFDDTVDCQIAAIRESLADSRNF